MFILSVYQNAIQKSLHSYKCIHYNFLSSTVYACYYTHYFLKASSKIFSTASRYLDLCELTEPSDNFDDVIAAVARKHEFFRSKVFFK